MVYLYYEYYYNYWNIIEATNWFFDTILWILASVYMYVHVPVNSGLVGINKYTCTCNQVGKLKLNCRNKIY